MRTARLPITEEQIKDLMKEIESISLNICRDLRPTLYRVSRPTIWWLYQICGKALVQKANLDAASRREE